VRDPTLPTTNDEYVTADEGARIAHVPIGTFRAWVSEERIHAAYLGSDGLFRYREADVLTVEANTRRAPRLRRLATEAASQLDTP
jgi:hypothetical protein